MTGRQRATHLRSRSTNSASSWALRGPGTPRIFGSPLYPHRATQERLPGDLTQGPATMGTASADVTGPSSESATTPAIKGHESEGTAENILVNIGALHRRT